MRVNTCGCRRFRSVVAAVSLTAVLGLAGGCGGSDDDVAASAPATTGPAVAAADEPTQAAGEDCGAAVNEIKASLTAMRAITSVDVPSCDKAVVTTSLNTDEKDTAAGMCQNAALEARTHGVASVSIVSADGTELAAGTTEMDCAAAKD